ncbi:phytanoyl-CoA dioxygenase family protein [Candidatus Pseudothioglobus singularis]|nr:phytanoyl-CoA dioxygenase family protein [Candidatus Pseudothioglobus singularis]
MDSKLKVNFFKKKGFVNFGSLNISSKDINELSKQCRNIYDSLDREDISSSSHGFNNLIVHDINTSSTLNKIFANNDIKSFLDDILGQNCKIWDINFRRSFPGDRGLYLHQDGPGQVNMAILLDDHFDGNGATAVLSGSHLVKKSQKKLRLELQPLFLNTFSFLFSPLSGKLGDVFFYSNRAWHGRFSNKSNINHDVLTVGIFPSGYSYGTKAWPESVIKLDSAPDLGSFLASSKDLEESILSSGTDARESKNIYNHTDHGYTIQIENIDYFSSTSRPLRLIISVFIIKCILFVSKPFMNVFKLSKSLIQTSKTMTIKLFK